MCINATFKLRPEALASLLSAMKVAHGNSSALGEYNHPNLGVSSGCMNSYIEAAWLLRRNAIVECAMTFELVHQAGYLLIHLGV